MTNSDDMATHVRTAMVADSVGALLRNGREEAGLAVRDVAERTKIPEKYVVLLEEDGSLDLAGDVYSRIYLKAYAKFLGFDPSALIDLRTRVRPDDSRAARPRHPSMSVPKSHLIVTPKVIQAVVLCLAVVALAFYFGFEVKKIVAPPQIQLTSPTDGMVTAERRITVEGRTEREVALTVNGKQVSPDGGGTFRDSLDLQEGLNVITIVGTKKYSREMIVTRRVIVTPKQKPTATVLPPEPSL